MITNESEGLAKLTEYLKQTRRQAEIAIDKLKKENDLGFLYEKI